MVYLNWRFITNRNINDTENCVVKEIHGSKQYTVQKVGRSLITIANEYGFAQFISRQVFKDSYVVQEVE